MSKLITYTNIPNPFQYKTNSQLRNKVVLYVIFNTYSNTPNIPEIYLINMNDVKYNTKTYKKIIYRTQSVNHTLKFTTR